MFRVVLGGIGLALAAACWSAPPEVPEMLRRAEAERPILEAARLRLEQARREAVAQGAYGVTRFETGLSSAPDLNGSEDFAIFHPLDLFGRGAAGRRVWRGTFAQALSEYRQARLDFQAETLTSLVEWATAKAGAEDGQKRIDLERAAYVSVQHRIEAGDLAPAQLLRADLDLRRAQIEFERRKSAVRAAEIRLTARGLTAPDATDRWDFSDLASEKDQRPDLLASMAVVATAKAEAGLSDKTNLPEFEVQVRRSPWATNEDKYDLRLQMVVPLWDHGAARATSAAARTRARAAEAELRDRQRLAEAAVSAARVELAAAKAAFEGYGPILADAEENLRKVRRGFDLGANSQLEVIDATRELSDVQDARVDAQRQFWLAEVQLLTERGILLAERKA
jgi:outer membrane protein TolC